MSRLGHGVIILAITLAVAGALETDAVARAEAERALGEACVEREAVAQLRGVEHLAQPAVEETPGYHWRLAVLPRVSRVAGYEQASGVYINQVLPERAADELRRSLG